VPHSTPDSSKGILSQMIFGGHRVRLQCYICLIWSLHHQACLGGAAVWRRTRDRKVTGSKISKFVYLLNENNTIYSVQRDEMPKIRVYYLI